MGSLASSARDVVVRAEKPSANRARRYGNRSRPVTPPTNLQNTRAPEKENREARVCEIECGREESGEREKESESFSCFDGIVVVQ